MNKILKKYIIIILCICNIIPYFVYAEEARDQDKEVISNETNNENNKEVTENQTEENITTQENETTNNQNKENGSNKSNNSSNSDGLNLTENAKSAIMIEASTGKIIYEKNSHESMPMASMTKIMTLLLIMENIENGNLKWDEKVTASEYAASMGGSQIFLQPGEEMTVEDLVKGICIGSGNDAAVAMAERIGGTEEEFVKMMNNKAKELGLKDTHFVNACGLDTENHYSSSYDMVMMAKELVKYEKILEFTGTYEEYLRKNTDNPFWLVNTNKLVRYYSGVDGLKTGYTKEAGYCITTTAKKNNMRLITVVMGEPSSQIRNSETTSMLDYGFNTYQIDNVVSKNTILSKQKVILGKEQEVEIVPIQDINILNSKNKTKKNITYNVKLNSIKAPIKKGKVVGKINILEDDKIIMTIDATVNKDISKANILTAYIRDLMDIIKGTL